MRHAARDLAMAACICRASTQGGILCNNTGAE